MSTYQPEHESWHDDITALQECNCEEAWAGRGLVDDRCWFHRAVEVVDILRENGWTVAVTIDYAAGQDERDKGTWVSTKAIVDAAVKGETNDS